MNTRNNMSWLAAITVAICQVISTVGVAASFDCGKAQTFRERTVCSDPQLSLLDEQLSAAYKSARAASPSPTELKDSQKAWMAAANQCSDATCLEKAYKERLAELGAATVPAQVAQVEPTVVPESPTSAVSEPQNSGVSSVPEPPTQMSAPSLPVAEPVPLVKREDVPASKPKAHAAGAVEQHPLHPITSTVFKLILTVFVLIPTFLVLLRLRVLLPGCAVDLNEDTFSFPGGSIEANSFGDYFKPAFLLQILKKFTIKLSEIQMLSAPTTSKIITDDKGNTKIRYRYFVEFTGAFGAAKIEFASEGKRDQLFSVIQQANKMGDPVYNTQR